MAWTLNRERGVWIASRYDDLQTAEIDNFAEYGEPFSPYEPGFIQDFTPDFAKIVVEMPQMQVMTVGYGYNVKPSDFPVVMKFLDAAKSSGLPIGTYSFENLVTLGFISEHDRWYNTDLYGDLIMSISPNAVKRHPGDISPADAAYIHGSVSFALKKTSRTKFIKTATARQVCVEMAAGDDNWDFESSNVPPAIEATLAAIETHYNLEKPISILFTGPGKLACIEDRSNPPIPKPLIGPAGR